MIGYEIRGAVRSDERELLHLAPFLNSVNLPNEPGHIQRLLDVSERSFSGALDNLRRRKYVFLLRDLGRDEAVGTSMIVAQLGRRDAPYIYLDVIAEEKYSSRLDKHFQHTVLRIGFSYDGPTEIGGLVVDPKRRRAQDKLGLLISYVRFLYIATHRQLFRHEILAELLPPLEPDGRSHLWEALGRRFTGISYGEADLLSSEDKTFVRDLFPSGNVYATLLSPEAQSVIGKVGAQTRGVERMLRRIGFRYAERIDPFDGGPHFVAQADEITLVQNTVRATLRAVRDLDASKPRALVGRDVSGPPFFRAVCTNVDLDGTAVIVNEASARALDAEPGSELFVLPLP
jgi:arginine N-succinyltransferase